jgi:hypothetical protein
LADFVTMEYVTEESRPTETLISGARGGGTQVMHAEPSYSAPEVTPDVVTPYSPSVEPAPAYGSAASSSPVEEYTPPPPPQVEDLDLEDEEKRPTWIYIVVGVLVVLICLCVALAVYLWFAPASFWERVFDLLGIPMPTGSIAGLTYMLLG